MKGRALLSGSAARRRTTQRETGAAPGVGVPVEKEQSDLSGPRERIRGRIRGRAGRGTALVAVLLVHLLAAYLILSGLAVHFVRQAARAIDVTAIELPLPDPDADAEPEPEGASAEAALEAEPPPVVAPPEIVLEDPPRPAPPAPAAAEGAEDSAGASDEPGPGTAAGGDGNGLGSGEGGFGTGGGGETVDAELREGAINGVYPFPPELLSQRRTDIAEYRFIVLPTGRIFGCRPQRTSGSAALDAYMCSLLEQRLRYQPARDAAGRPVADEKAYRQEWGLRR